MSRSDDLEATYALASALAGVEGRMTELVSHVRGLVVNDVLFSGTVVLDNAGMFSLDINVPFGSVTVGNGSSSSVTVTNHTPSSSAPTAGAGVHTVGAGKSVHIGMAGNVVTLYGNAGASVALIVNAGMGGHQQLAPASQATVTVALGAGTTQLAASPGSIQGWAFRETAGAAARVSLYDGTDNTGKLLVPISLVANESTRDFPGGLSFSKLASVIVSGAVEGAVFLRANA